MRGDINMNEYKAEALKNVVLLGHLGSGKTSLSESLAFISGRIDKKGSIEKKTTISDNTVEEQNKLSSLTTGLIPIEFKDIKINILDAPGADEMIGDVDHVLSVSSAAILVVDATSGIEVGTEKMWLEIKKRKLPAFIFVNKMDKENVKFDEVLEEIRTKLGKEAVPFCLPLGKSDEFNGFADIVELKARIYDGNACIDGDIYPDKMDKVESLRQELIETVAGADEALLEKYFEGEELTMEEIRKGLHLSVMSGEAVPVMVGSATKDIGILTLLHMIKRYFPSVSELEPVKGVDDEGKEVVRTYSENEPFSAFVFKTLIDPFIGTISIMQIKSGSVKKDQELYVSSTTDTEKGPQVFTLLGKTQIPMEIAYAGDICAMAKVNGVTTGTTLSEKKNIVIYPQVVTPSPTMYVAIHPENKKDEDKLSTSLTKLQLEDNTLEVRRNKETSQLLIGGQGMIHLGYIIDKMKNMFKVPLETEDQRIDQTLEIIKSIPKSESIIVWTKQNPESDKIYKLLTSLGYDCRNVKGSDSVEKKEKDLLGFAHKDYQILITKESIASMGLNYQHCGYQIFNSIDFSFERTYQALRRSWRFGRKNKVTAYMVTTDRMINVSRTQQEKQKNFQNMQQEMAKAVSKNLNNKLTMRSYNKEDIKTDNYWLMLGDCVQRIKEVPDNSADIVVFSPPFADLYVYSNKIEDMGNVTSYDEFKDQFKFLVPELKRVIKPGRLICVHSMNLPTLKSRDGYIGLRRFNSMIGDLFENEDMFLHSEHAIWKDPLLAAVRTKTKGLSHQQLLKDSAQVRTGIFDLIQCFKTKEPNEIPVTHELLNVYIPMHDYDTFPKNLSEWKKAIQIHPDLYDPESKYSIEEQYSHQIWQRYASPVWMDIDATNTLQYSKARGNNDEKHICPLQLPVIARLLTLYSNKNETLLSPFGGIGSEGYQALMMDRKSISIELKESYFEVNKRNHRNAIEKKGQLTFL